MVEGPVEEEEAAPRRVRTRGRKRRAEPVLEPPPEDIGRRLPPRIPQPPPFPLSGHQQAAAGAGAGAGSATAAAAKPATVPPKVRLQGRKARWRQECSCSKTSDFLVTCVRPVRRAMCRLYAQQKVGTKSHGPPSAGSFKTWILRAWLK